MTETRTISSLEEQPFRTI